MCERVIPSGKCSDLRKSPWNPRVSPGTWLRGRARKQWAQLATRGRRGAGHIKFGHHLPFSDAEAETPIRWPPNVKN